MHLEAINSEGQKIFKKLKNFPQFYLAGGTALALQIGHRISEDFDLFSEGDIPSNLIQKIEKVFKDEKIKVVISHPEQLSLIIGKSKVEFIKYPFPLILDVVEYEKVKIAQVCEIGAMKAYNLERRASYKDYVDLFFIISEGHCSLLKIIKICKKKFKEKFDQRLFLEELVYLEDVKEEPIDFLKKKVSKKEIEKFFQKEIKKIKLE